MQEPILRIAQSDDKEKISAFLNQNWRRFNLINNDELFHHYFAREDQLNFVLAEGENGELFGTLAFIYFDYNGRCVNHTLLKTIASPYTFLSAKLFEFFENQFPYTRYVGVNMAPNTAALHKLMGHVVERMPHYYRLQDQPNYKIAVIREKKILPARQSAFQLVRFETPESLFSHFEPPADRVPYKDRYYITKRYYEYPAYDYVVYGLHHAENGRVHTVLMAREILVNGVKVLKIVDLIGRDEEFAQASGEIQRLMDENEYEYIEMYAYGMPAQIMAAAGFLQRDENDPNIIPTYLEPLEQVNTEYMLYHQDDMDGIRLFKADGDQDRPNKEA